jgi:dihydroxyacid dehydratase/phosphogluconate dehydratase
MEHVPGTPMIRTWCYPADKPITKTGGVVGLKGNLAEDGAIVKVAGMSKQIYRSGALFRFRGRVLRMLSQIGITRKARFW